MVESAADGRLLHLVPAASDGSVRGDGANTVAVAASELRLQHLRYLGKKGTGQGVGGEVREGNGQGKREQR